MIAVSGGRTSMYMLRRYLDRYGNRLPDHAVAVFCNTGKEHPRTLDFVQQCSDAWGCPIVWVEYRDADEPSDRWTVVDYRSASRHGEPFAAMIRRKGILPNAVSRICTQELKIHATHRWAKACWPHGKGRYVKAIGFRADEPARVAKSLDRCGKRKDPWDLVWPLYTDRIDKRAILTWWSEQPFDLDLPERLGNCDLCFLKSKTKLGQNLEENPALAEWWIAMQREVGGYFRSPMKGAMPGYEDLLAWARSKAPKPWKQGDLLDGIDALSIDCNCTD